MEIRRSVEGRWIVTTPEELDDMLFAMRERYHKAEVEYPEFVRKLDNVEVAFDLPFPLNISLRPTTDEEWEKYRREEIVELKTTDRRGKVPRGQVTVSTSALRYGGPLYLCVDLFPHLLDRGRSHSLTDRGLCWVSPGEKANVYLTIKNWEKEPWDKGEIAKIIHTAEERAKEVIEMVLKCGV